MGAKKCCLLQIPWPWALDPAVPHSNPAGTPAADFWPSWPGRTIGRRVVTYVPLYTHILGFLTSVCWQACGRKQLLMLLAALHSSLGPVLPAGATRHGWEPKCDSLLRKEGQMVWRTRETRQAGTSTWLSEGRCAKSWLVAWGGKGGPLPLGSLLLPTWVDITGKHRVYSSIPVREACVTSKRSTGNEGDSLSHLQKPRAM